MAQEGARGLSGRMWMGMGPGEQVNDVYRPWGVSVALGGDLTQ